MANESRNQSAAAAGAAMANGEDFKSELHRPSGSRGSRHNSPQKSDKARRGFGQHGFQATEQESAAAAAVVSAAEAGDTRLSQIEGMTDPELRQLINGLIHQNSILDRQAKMLRSLVKKEEERKKIQMMVLAHSQNKSKGDKTIIVQSSAVYHAKRHHRSKKEAKRDGRKDEQSGGGSGSANGHRNGHSERAGDGGEVVEVVEREDRKESSVETKRAKHRNPESPDGGSKGKSSNGGYASPSRGGGKGHSFDGINATTCHKTPKWDSP